MPESLIFKNGEVITEEKTIACGYVHVQAGQIVAVGEGELEKVDPHTTVVELEKGDKLVPGFIDIHIHGSVGYDVMDGKDDSVKKISKSLPSEGTTSFLPTTITQSVENKYKALQTVARVHEAQVGDGAEIVGIHLEGPFIAEKRAGAQPKEHIQAPNLEQFERFQDEAKQLIRLVTMAPEEPGGEELVTALNQTGVIASIGHSDATSAEVQKANAAGATHATHLFNGMRGMHHREVGTVGGVFLNQNIIAELIVDGVHISPEMVEITYHQKGEDGIVLITDSIRAKGLGDGDYELGGQPVKVENQRAYLADGTLAGSTLHMIDGVKNMIQFTSCSLKEAVKMASLNPAKQIGVANRKGSITAGKDADLVILNESLEIKATYINGHLVYRR